ncbi:hypothetical protein Q31b_28240 [Novipirellula aureliae]|uniref:Uncharacterized protein n=1 Tax=Novipirellula aureliae TaxID=2527966 RepID=A0A5C6DXB9_9BACT|nr:hypothetical protein Q31b_28240 [Novipirellula aureliae]
MRRTDKGDKTRYATVLILSEWLHNHLNLPA